MRSWNTVKEFQQCKINKGQEWRISKGEKLNRWKDREAGSQVKQNKIKRQEKRDCEKEQNMNKDSNKRPVTLKET